MGRDGQEGTAMQNRMRMLMGATALLYIGPLMAGLGGYGWAIVPVFLALFLLWLFILRPQQWPQSFADWGRSEAWVTLFTNATMQLLLITLLFGVGRGIGGALGVKLPLGEMLPISISFLSIPLARLIWDPWKSGARHSLLDQAIHAQAPHTTPADQVALDLARRLIAPLADLPDFTEPATIAQHLTALAPHADPAQIRTALMERLGNRQANRAETIALILHSTDAGLAAGVPGDGPTLALSLLPADAELIALFAHRLSDALSQNPDLWGKSPSIDLLAELVVKYDNTPAEAPLRDLIEATNRAQPEDGLA